MIYWILYGAFATSHSMTVYVPRPLLFKSELKCLQTKELNEKNDRNKYETIDLICLKVELEK